jgi:exodeoxyribonuclease VII small subunit
MSKDASPEPSPLSGEAAQQFEVAYGKLQQVVGQLEQGNLTLAQSLQAYEQGVGWLKTCYRGLQEVEQQIRILTKVDADGQVHWESFDATASLNQVDGETPRAAAAHPARADAPAARGPGSTTGRRKKIAAEGSDSDDSPSSQPRLF